MIVLRSDREICLGHTTLVAEIGEILYSHPAEES